MKRVDAWTARHLLSSQWSFRRPRCVIWERDERYDYRDISFYWKRYTIRLVPGDGGSRIHARAACRKWFPIAALTWMIGLVVSGLAGLAWDLLVQRSDLQWGRPLMMSLIFLAASAFPFRSWRAQRREAAAQLGDLAASLADVLAHPPDPPPATDGPYR